MIKIYTNTYMENCEHFLYANSAQSLLDNHQYLCINESHQTLLSSLLAIQMFNDDSSL
jgi:hypothetical protein